MGYTINWDGSGTNDGQPDLIAPGFDSAFPMPTQAGVDKAWQDISSQLYVNPDFDTGTSLGKVNSSVLGQLSQMGQNTLYSNNPLATNPDIKKAVEKAWKDGYFADRGGGWEINPLALAAIFAGGVGAFGGLEGLFGSAGLVDAPISADVASAAMGGGVDAAGWGSSALDGMGYLEELGVGSEGFSPSSWKEMSNYLNPSYTDYGIQNPVTTPYTPDYGTLLDAEQAVQYGADTGTVGLDAGGYTPIDTLGSTNKLQSLFNTLKQGGLKSMDLSKLFKTPSTGDMIWSGVKALGSMYGNSQAQDAYKRAFDMINNDPNRARGNAANQLWLDNWQNPTASYNTFMQGVGRDFINQARAAAAKNGSRGGYLNSGRMTSDLASLFAKQQVANSQALAGGFDNTNPGASIASLTPGYASLQANSLAPIGQAIDSVLRKDELANIFGL